MLKLLTLCLLALALTSCASVKSKQKLVKRGVNAIVSKNYIEQGKEYSFTMSGNVSSLSKDSLKYISRKQIKMRLYAWEHFLALIPDTTIENNGHIDSFYANPGKISYIERNNLKTGNILFSKMSD